MERRQTRCVRVTTEGSWVLCCGRLLHAFRMRAGLMDGPRLEISQCASEQDAGGGLCSPRRKYCRREGGGGAGEGQKKDLSLIKLPPPATSPLCLLSALYPSCHKSLIPPHLYITTFCSTSKCSPLLWAALSVSAAAHTRSQTSLREVFNVITRWQPRHYALGQGEMDSGRG